MSDNELANGISLISVMFIRRLNYRSFGAGVLGPEHGQDQSMTTLFGRVVTLKFQDHSMTTQD